MKPFRKNCTEEQWKVIVDEILDHAKEICENYNGYHSDHEALGVMTEEWAEWIDAIHRNDVKQSVAEAKQLAAGFMVFCALFKKKL